MIPSPIQRNVIIGWSFFRNRGYALDSEHVIRQSVAAVDELVIQTN